MRVCLGSLCGKRTEQKLLFFKKHSTIEFFFLKCLKNTANILKVTFKYHEISAEKSTLKFKLTASINTGNINNKSLICYLDVRCGFTTFCCTSSDTLGCRHAVEGNQAGEHQCRRITWTELQSLKSSHLIDVNNCEGKIFSVNWCRKH